MIKKILFLITASYLFLFVACSKEDRSVNNERGSFVEQIKNIFSENGYDSKLSTTLNNSVIIDWVPDWDQLYQKEASGSLYYYIPLRPTSRNVSKDKIVIAGFEKFIVVKTFKSEEKFTYYIGTYIVKNDIHSRARRQICYQYFNGISMLEELGDGRMIAYQYEQGTLSPNLRASFTNSISAHRGPAEVQSINLREGISSNSNTAIPMECDKVCSWSAYCTTPDGGVTIHVTATYAPYGQECGYPLSSIVCADNSTAIWAMTSTRDINCIIAGPPPGPGPDEGGGGGGTGGNPPPLPNDPNNPPQEDALPSTNPCDEEIFLNQQAKKAIISAQNLLILNNTIANNLEYGSEEVLVDWLEPGIYKERPVREGGVDELEAQFTWNATDGYVVGSTHSHPNRTAPSPNDIFELYINSTDLYLVNSGQDAVSFYKSNARLTVITGEETYAISVKNWEALATLYNSVKRNLPKFSQDLVDRGDELGSYEKALIEKFGKAVNFFKAFNEDRKTFYGYTLDANKQFQAIPCP